MRTLSILSDQQLAESPCPQNALRTPDGLLIHRKHHWTTQTLYWCLFSRCELCGAALVRRVAVFPRKDRLIEYEGVWRQVEGGSTGDVPQDPNVLRRAVRASSAAWRRVCKALESPWKGLNLDDVE